MTCREKAKAEESASMVDMSQRTKRIEECAWLSVSKSHLACLLYPQSYCSMNFAEVLCWNENTTCTSFNTVLCTIFQGVSIAEARRRCRAWRSGMAVTFKECVFYYLHLGWCVVQLKRH